MMIQAFRGVLISLLASCVALVTSAAAASEGAAKRHSDQSYYVDMRDGVSLAMSLYFPKSRQAGAKVPAVLMQTRYGRAGLGTWVRTQRWLDDGFVVVAVDTRGSTASFGQRLTELSPQQIADVDEIVRHVKSQPWSWVRSSLQGSPTRPTRPTWQLRVRQPIFSAVSSTRRNSTSMRI